MSDSRVRRIARRTREAVVLYSREMSRHGHPFDPYSLRGACALASSVLWHELRAAGFDPRLVRGNYWDGDLDYDHAWLLLDDRHLDITATQFGDFPEVLLRRRSPWFTVAKAGRPCDLFRSWYKFQRPTRERIRFVRNIIINHG